MTSSPPASSATSADKSECGTGKYADEDEAAAGVGGGVGSQSPPLQPDPAPEIRLPPRPPSSFTGRRPLLLSGSRRPNSWRHPGGTVSETEESEFSEAEAGEAARRDHDSMIGERGRSGQEWLMSWTFANTEPFFKCLLVYTYLESQEILCLTFICLLCKGNALESRSQIIRTSMIFSSCYILM